MISVESGPFVEKQQAYVVVRHSKFASKGSKKKAVKVAENAATTAASASLVGGGAADLDIDLEPEDEVLPDEPVKRFEEASQSGRGVENLRSDQGRTNPRGENRESPNQHQLDIKGGNDGSPPLSYGIFSAPTHPTAGNQRTEGINRNRERNSPSGRRR